MIAGMPLLSTPRSPLSFAQEVRDFIAFLRDPQPAPRLPGRLAPGRTAHSWQADWFGGLHLGRLFQWCLALWAINLFVLGPLAVSVAGSTGAQHRFNLENIPWLAGILWAPIVEELAFRYGLRRPVQALWFTPIVLFAVFMGMQGWTAGVVVLAVFVAWRALLMRRDQGVTDVHGWRRTYCLKFGWAFHLSALVFAGVHLNNFNLGATHLWLLPALVLPQYLTGLVLGWLRVRRGIGACVVLHAIFNTGPLLLVWMVVTMMPEGALTP